MRRRLFDHLIATTASAIAATLPVPNTAWAQEAEQLPEIVVEGATLQSAKARPKPAKKTVAAPEVSNPQSAKSKTATKPKSASAAEAKPSPTAGQPTTDVVPDTTVNAGAAQGDPATGEAQSAGIPIDRVGSAVAVVTGEQLKARQIRHAGDALRSLPGVHVSRSNGVTGLTQVRIRGAEGNHTLVLIDGIKANNSTNGEFDFSDLSTDQIERIEVIRGAQSSIYGSGAIGGVINIVTKGGKGPLTFRAFGETGTFGTREGGASVSAGSDNIWGNIALSKRETGGYNIAVKGPENDGGELATFAFKGGVSIAKGLTLDMNLRHTNKDGDRDTEDAVVGKLQEQRDDASTFNATTWLQGGHLTWDTLGGDLTQSLGATHNETHRTDTSPEFFFTTDNLGETINYAYTGTYRFDLGMGLRNAVTWLVEDEKERFTPNSLSFDPSPFAFNFRDDGFTRVRNHMGYAGEWRADFADRLIVTAGVRHDDNDSFEDFTTWRTTATLRLPEIGLRPHASAGTAVKTPTMFEQFGTIPLFFTPNPALVPEESFSWDAGLELATANRKHWVDVTYFESVLENQINGFASGPNGTFTSVNREGTSTREGIEVAASSELFSGLTLSGGYTYLEAKTPDGLDEVRRPRHSGRADINYAFGGGKGNLSVGAIYNGEMDDPVRRTILVTIPGCCTFLGASPERFTLDEYWVVNVAASYEIMKGVELYGRVENAFNEDYQEVFGFETADVAGYVGVRLTGVVEESRAWSEGR